YRRFTQDVSATLQDQWDRVAGGELAMSPQLKKRVPIDDDGYLRLGSSEEDPRIHVGAYAPQIPTVDLVVNAAWGEELGLTDPNALLVSARNSTPQALSKPVGRLAGDLAPQNLDIASRLGLDPGAVQVAVPVGTFADAVGTFRYSVLNGGRIAPDPGWVKSHITTEVVPILGSVTCNRAIFPQLKAALAEIVARGLADEIHPDEYAGCYYPRFIAGSTTLSNHAFGLALDLNVPGNQRGTVGEIDRVVVDIFKSWGFGWGGDWNYTDPMHFELNRIVNPG
ncbi:MAG: M15 family metallopeptidase, partial [Nocardioides sp.]